MLDQRHAAVAATASAYSQVRGETSSGDADFLTFRLGADEYRIDILNVQQILGYEQSTAIADMPSFIKGVITLRDTIVPIVDLRIMFDLGEAKYDNRTAVIVLSMAGRMAGFVVDGISDVITLTSAAISPLPEFSASVGTRYSSAIGSAEERMLMTVVTGQLMSGAGIALVDPVSH